MRSFHNAGGMILRGPGARTGRPYPAGDARAYDLIGKEGEKILPGYRYGVIFLKFNDTLTSGRMFVDWKPFQHPQYGAIEIGGLRHDTGRPPEGFLREEECHRNASFVLFHASHLPGLSFQEPQVASAGPNLWRVHLPVLIDRAIPSMLEIARQLKPHRPDLATVEGAKVIAAGEVTDEYLHKVDLQTARPERLMVYGVPGLGVRTLLFLVEGAGEISVTYDSVKAGRLTRKVALR
jgi:hypothetical protein